MKPPKKGYLFFSGQNFSGGKGFSNSDFLAILAAKRAFSAENAWPITGKIKWGGTAHLLQRRFQSVKTLAAVATICDKTLIHRWF